MAAVALQAPPFCLTFTLLVDQDAPKPHRRFKGGKMSPVPRTACQGPDQRAGRPVAGSRGGENIGQPHDGRGGAVGWKLVT